MVAEFQEEVLNVLNEADPKLRAGVIRKLKERRAIKGLIKAA